MHGVVEVLTGCVTISEATGFVERVAVTSAAAAPNALGVQIAANARTLARHRSPPVLTVGVGRWRRDAVEERIGIFRLVGILM